MMNTEHITSIESNESRKKNVEQLVHSIVNMIDEQFGEEKKKLENEIDDHQRTKEDLHATQLLLEKKDEKIIVQEGIIIDHEKEIKRKNDEIQLLNEKFIVQQGIIIDHEKEIKRENDEIQLLNEKMKRLENRNDFIYKNLIAIGTVSMLCIGYLMIRK